MKKFLRLLGTIIFSLPVYGIELVIEEGSAFVRMDESRPFERQVSNLNLPSNTDWQTSADFVGGVLFSGGYYPLGAASHFALRGGMLYRRENTRFRQILEIGEESESSRPAPSTDLEIMVNPSILLSRKNTFENREVSGRIRLREGDHIRTPDQGLQELTLPDGTKCWFFPNSEAVLSTTRLVLLAGEVQVAATNANQRFEVLLHKVLATMIGEQAHFAIQPDTIQARAYALKGVLRLEARIDKGSGTDLLSPGEGMVLRDGRLKEKFHFASGEKNALHEASGWIQAARDSLLSKGDSQDLMATEGLFISEERQRAEEITQRAKKYQRVQEGLEEEAAPSQALTKKSTRPFDYLDQGLVPRNYVTGLDRQAAQSFTYHPGGLRQAPYHGGERQEQERSHELGEINQSLEERVRLQKEGIRLGIDPQAIRQGKRISDSQMAQTQQFLVQRERELSRVQMETDRHEREREQLDRKLELLERRGGDPTTLQRLRQDKQELLVRSEELRQSQRRLQELIRSTREELIVLRQTVDKAIRNEDRALKSMRERLR